MEQSISMEELSEAILNIYRHKEELPEYLYESPNSIDIKNWNREEVNPLLLPIIDDFNNPSTLWRYYLTLRRPLELVKFANHLVDGGRRKYHTLAHRLFFRIAQDLSGEKDDINDEEILRQEVLIRRKMLEIDQAEAQRKLQSFDQNMHEKFKINQDLIDQHKTQLSELEHQN